MNRLFRVFFLALLFNGAANGQTPPPVDIPIQNIPQQTPVWCWAAVAQQIINFQVGQNRTPAQCALVAMANNAHPNVCCYQQNPVCLRTGSFPQIAALINYFGGRPSSYALPTDPMTLYQTLSSGRPIILQVRSSLVSTHVVVLRGMSFIQTPYGIEPILHINDPLAYFTQPISFSNLVSIWIDGIVIN